MSRRNTILFAVSCVLMLVLMAVAACVQGASSTQAALAPHDSFSKQDLGAPEGSERVAEESIPVASHAATPVVFDEADRILHNVKKTHYQHNLLFNETSGTYLCDCSGLVDYVLGRVAPDALAKIKTHSKTHHPKEKRPLAQDYYEYFTELKAGSAGATSSGKWSAVKKLTDATKGDVIAYKYTKAADKPDTGHVMIIAGTPEPTGQHYWKHLTWKQYKVRVIDSANSGHDEDKRTKTSNGVGAGFMYYYVDSSGTPVGFCWNDQKGTVRADELIGIAVGRVVRP